MPEFNYTISKIFYQFPIDIKVLNGLEKEMTEKRHYIRIGKKDRRYSKEGLTYIKENWERIDKSLLIESKYSYQSKKQESERANKINRLIAQGKKISEIMEITKFSYQTIYYHWNLFKIEIKGELCQN